MSIGVGSILLFHSSTNCLYYQNKNSACPLCRSSPSIILKSFITKEEVNIIKTEFHQVLLVKFYVKFSLKMLLLGILNTRKPKTGFPYIVHVNYLKLAFRWTKEQQENRRISYSQLQELSPASSQCNQCRVGVLLLQDQLLEDP